MILWVKVYTYIIEYCQLTVKVFCTRIQSEVSFQSRLVFFITEVLLYKAVHEPTAMVIRQSTCVCCSWLKRCACEETSSDIE